jgi:hypothetical protein
LEKIKALPKGFELVFSQAIDPATLAKLKVKSHTYAYHQAYGAPKAGEQEIVPKAVVISPDGLKLTLDIGPLKENHLHLIDMSGLLAKDGSKIHGDKAWYQVVKAPK